MNGICRFFEDCSYTALTGIALGISVLLVGGGALVVGGIWIFWRILDALHLPTMLLFRGAWWLFYWPGMLIARHSEEPNELAVVALSGFGWLLTLTVLLNAGKYVVGRLK